MLLVFKGCDARRSVVQFLAFGFRMVLVLKGCDARRSVVQFLAFGALGCSLPLFLVRWDAL
jgi:hypothetical protein